MSEQKKPWEQNWNQPTANNSDSTNKKPWEQNWSEEKTDRPKDKGFLGQAKDLGVSLIPKGLAGVAELGVGLSDIMSDGATGKILQDKGIYNAKEVREELNTWHTDQYQEQLKEKANVPKQEIKEDDSLSTQAGKLFDNTKEYLKFYKDNPSMIANTVAESIAPMVAGGLLGRATGIANPIAAGAVGEGTVMAGSQAEQIRQETVDGRLTADQSLAGATTGALGGLLGFAGGRLAQKMGIGDVDTMLVTGRAGPAEIAGEIASMPAKSLPRRVVEGAISEGFLEELPQSVSEQILQNLALDKPWHDGIEDAAVMGTLAGMAMGGAANILSGHNTGTESQDNQQPPSAPNLPSAPSQLGSSPDSALAGEYIPRENVPQDDNQGRTAFVYDQPSMEADNLLNNNYKGDVDFDTSGNFDPSNNPLSPSGGNYFEDHSTQPQLPSERLGINPDDGPMSSAAALAVDSGASNSLTPLTDATFIGGVDKAQSAQSEYSDSTAQAIQYGMNEIAQGAKEAAVENTIQRLEKDGEVQLFKEDSIAKALENQNYNVRLNDDGSASIIGVKNPATNQWHGQSKEDASRVSTSLENTVNQQNNDLSNQLVNLEQQFEEAKTVPEKARIRKEINALQQNNTLDQPTETQNKAILGADGQNKWFGSQAKADAFVTKKGITDTHHVVQTENKRFEIQPIDQNQDESGDIRQAKNIDQPSAIENTISASENNISMPKNTILDAQNNIDKTQTNNVVDQLAQLEQQFLDAKSVPQKAKLKKQIDQLKSQQTEITTTPFGSEQIQKQYGDTAESVMSDIEILGDDFTIDLRDDNKKTNALNNPNYNAVQKADGSVEIVGMKHPSTGEWVGKKPNAISIEENAHQAATSSQNNTPEPTQAQIEAGNYKKGHIKVNGLDISIENPKGSERRGTDPNGKEWAHTMSDHYGYIKRTKGADNEHIDTYIGNNPDSNQVFIVDQIDQESGNFDEHKVMLGFDSQEDATTAYQSNFDKGWKVGPIRTMNMEQFKDWLKNEDTSKPATESNPHSTQSTKTSDPFAGNKIFTSDVVAKARERLKKKLGQLNSGIDPEVLIDGMTIAGAYIESGFRKFGDYAKAMVADFGEDIKPYLLSFWEGARNYPNLDTNGMTSVEQSKQEFDALNQTAKLSHDMKKVVGEQVSRPKNTKKPKVDNTNRQLVQDWGVLYIDGWATNSEHTGKIYTDNGLKDGVKAAFLKDTKQYLESVQKQLEQQGYRLHLDKKGKPQKISVNESGTATAGQVTLTMINDGGVSIYVSVSDSAMSSAHPQRIAILFRATTDLSNILGSGWNQWAATDLTTSELAQAIDREAQRVLKSSLPKLNQGQTDAGIVQTKDVSSNDTQPAPADATTDNRDSQSLDDGVAKTSGSSNRDRGVSGRTEVSGRTGTNSVQQRAEPSSGTPRDSGTVRTGRSTTVSEQRELDPATAETSDKPVLDTDFDLQSEDIGKGGLRQKYKDNIATIKILKILESENRVATPEERKQIAQYTGWGALKGVFDKDNKQWTKEYQELKDLLTDAEYKAARASVLNAHFTSKDVVNGIVSIVDRLGFKSGRVLEPSVGTGNFFGLMPASLRKKSELHGVELDPITSQIVAALYPSAKIAKATGFQDFQIPAEYFDLVIGNPPFGNEPIVDNDRSPYSGFSIHNYFFAKSIEKLRPGGILAMVVSRNFMDARTNNTRKWIAERADLVAAVRLPNTAFKENAGTEVVTDIIVLRKRGKDEAKNNTQWVETGLQDLTNNKTGETARINVNQYFIDNPQHILGEPTAGGSMYRANEYTVESINYPLDTLLRNWVSSNIPENIYQPISRTDVMTSANYSVPDSVKVGSFFINNQGDVLQRGEDELGSKTAQSWLSPNNKAMERMKGMIALRDTLRDQMRLEKSLDADTKQIESNRKKLNELYDQFQKNYGYLNNQTNRRIFLDDTESALVQALEFDYDRGVSKLVAEREGTEQRQESATKADIFARRVLFPPANNIKVHNANDALLASLNYKGKVDLDYMAGLYDKPVNEIISELGDAVYSDPIRGVVMADEYLSGDVKTKLEEAQAIAKDNSEFKRNVDALKKVIPKDKLPSEIHATLGANFIPVEVYQQFTKEVTGADFTFRYLKATGQWIATINSVPDTALNVGKWGIEKMPATDILTRTMAGQGVVVTRTVKMADGSTRTEVLEKETEAAREKQAALKVEWQRWLWTDPDRAENIATIYNDKMNRIVNRKFDGSHLTFPGMNPVMALLPHQKNAVWRILQDRQVLLDHVVGAGKTFEIVTAFMEMRRLGIARKPFIAVPNHLTLQWRSEFNRLYPGSNILAATPDDFTKGNREKFFSKIITGDWDAVIVGHSSLKKIALPPETEKAVLEEQIHEISSAIEEIKRDRGDRNIIRDMENIKARLENRMKQRIQNLGERDNVVTFDELGADAFAVDELHEFKNLFYNTTMQRVPGMGNPKGSDKAFDLFVKLQWMFNTFGNDNTAAIGATGTPVSNSLVEMFNMQRLLQYPTLKANDLHIFDAWAKQFGSVESVYEVSPSGTGFRQSNRFSKFKNLPALMALYNSFADTVTLDDLKAQEIARGKTFPVPKIVGGRPQNVVAKRSEQVAEFMGTPELEMVGGQPVFQFDPLIGDTFAIVPQDNGGVSLGILDESGLVKVSGLFPTEEDARLALVEYALTPQIFVDEKSILGQFNNLKQLTRETKGKVNALSLTGQANKAGLDYRLIDPTAPDFKDSKINKAVAHTLDNYQKWNKDKGTQLIFCDMSIPLSARSGFANKERRVYVRNEGNLVHKKGTMHTVEGHEDIPFFVIKEGSSKDKISFVVYDAVSGQRIKGGMPSKTMAIEQATNLINKDNSRQVWIDAIERVGEIEQEVIDEYNNEHEIDAEATESITRDDIAGSSGATQFSVYDDIKNKLVAQGIPEREIAFIHDYNTPSAKEKLFKAVNKGTIRVLLGSTQKMGAGTNVQERLVGLHHIDAPWKPSDLEQREGRIVRRGNKLYERDPDNFEVAIYRYATEQTYDTRRWQILEHKARGIEQLRNYDGSLNEIDDIEGEAANAADMKAAASGDPLILEETQLRNEVRRLETLQSANVDEKQMLRSRIRQSQRYINETAPGLLDEYQSLIDTAKKHPVPSDKDSFVGIKVNRQSYSKRDDAVKAVESQLKNAFAGQREVVFNYRGIAFSLENIAGIVYLNAPNEQMMALDISKDKLPSPSGMLTRLANYIGRLDDYINDVKQKIEDAKKQITSMQQQLEQPFAQAQDLSNAREAHKRVQRRLIAKGPDIPTHQKPILEKAIDSQRIELEKQGLGDALKEFEGINGKLNDFSRDKLKPDNERRGTSPLDTTFNALSVVSATRRVLSALQHLKLSATQDSSISGRITVGSAGIKGGFDVQVISSFDGLPTEIQKDATYQDDKGNTQNYDVSAVWHKGTLYVVADQVYGDNEKQLTTFDAYEEMLAHEIIGHFGVQQIFGQEYKTKLQQLYNALGELEGIRKIASKNGVDMAQFETAYIEPYTQGAKEGIYAESDVQQALVGELFAFVAQNAKSRPFVRQKLKEVIGYIRQWFRDRGFDKFLSRYNDADLMMFLSEARKAVVDRSYFGKYKNQEFSSKNNSDTPLYSRRTKSNSGSTTQQVRDVLIDRFGKETIDELERQGKLEIIQDYQVEGVEGFYYNGKAVLVASNLTAESTVPTFLHELGGHAGFQNMMTQKQYNELMNQFNKLVDQGNPVAMAAKLLAEREQGSERQHLEYLPYLLTLSSTMQQRNVVQRNALQKLINNLVTYVKATLFDNFGINLNLNPNDIVALAERMIEKSSYNAENATSPLYSRQSMQDTIDKLSQNLKSLTIKSIKDKSGDKKIDWLGIGLSALGRRQLTEIYAKLLPQLNKYNELAAQMDADKNDAGAEADSIVREWANLNDEDQLAELMHDSTLAKIDPTKPYVSGDSISKYKQLRDAYNSLSPEAQAMYLKARDAYKKHYAKVHQAIKERILRSELSNQKKADLLKQMDNQFFGYTKGVYFPLARFGKYVVVMRNQNGDVESVSRAETMGEAQALRSELIQKFPHYKVNKVKLDKEYNKSRDAVGRGFMTSLFAEVDNLGLSTAERTEFEDTLSQLYLSSMPDLSWAKHGIHRKGTAGFSQDARRAFAQNMFSGANYLAKLRYGDQLAQQLDDMQKYADEQFEVDEDYDQRSAQSVITEMNKRHDNLMNPKGHPLSSALTSMGFIYYLGLSPAAAMVNLSQTALVAYPLMGAKWDFDKAGKELLKASNDFRKGVEFHKVKWQGTKTDLYKAVSSDISKFLNKDEQAAYQKAVDSGVIDVTQAHDLAGIAQGEDSGVMWKTRPIMRAASVMFHSAERFNREVTFIASYRLARQAGANHDDAYKQADKMTYDSHYDYGSGNRPRIMQGNVAKVLLLFKQFGQNMVYTLARQTYQSIKGETKEERREARRAISAILAMHATFAGALGLPMVGMLLSVASWMGGDDDDPWDAEVALRNYLAEAFNPTISNMLMKGAPRGIGVDISGRVGINNLLLPDVQEGLEGKKWWDSASAAVLGPIGGIGANIAKGAQEISEGHNLRGVESMLPVFLKNFAKTYRYADEGVQDKTGVSIMDEVSSMDLLVQGMGFSPSDVRTANEGKTAIYQLNRKLNERRSRLMTLWSRAKMMDDQQEMDEIWEEIQGFNDKNPSRRITRMNLNQSYRNRQRRIDRAEDGIYLSLNRQDAREAGYFAFGE